MVMVVVSLISCCFLRCSRSCSSSSSVVAEGESVGKLFVKEC